MKEVFVMYTIFDIRLQRFLQNERGKQNDLSQDYCFCLADNYCHYYIFNVIR